MYTLLSEDYLLHLLGGTTSAIPRILIGEGNHKCGFGLYAELMQSAPEATMRLRQEARSRLAELYIHSFVNGSGDSTRFHISYEITGNDAVPPDDLNMNGIPDYVDEVGLAFERSYRLQVDTLGYLEPINFDNDGFYPVLISNLVPRCSISSPITATRWVCL